jgi:SOS-response transcriptional repressor LexA
MEKVDEQLAAMAGRVRARIHAVGLTVAATERAAGLGEDAVRNLFRAEKGAIKLRGVTTYTIMSLLPVLKTSAGWLMEGIGEEHREVKDIPVRGQVGEAVSDAKAQKVVDLDKLRKMIAAAQARSSLPTISARPVRLDRDVPVVGYVAAGEWQEVIPDSEEISEYLPIDVQGYERASLYALKVVGPSMNLHYPAGRYVVVAPVAEAGLREFDHVIVERSRGDMIELTIKELVHDGNRVALWPRSDHPEHQTPIYLRAARSGAGEVRDQAAPRIIGIVVADYGKRSRGDRIFNPSGSAGFGDPNGVAE